jgi:hypothetical protein
MCAAPAVTISTGEKQQDDEKPRSLRIFPLPANRYIPTRGKNTYALLLAVAMIGLVIVLTASIEAPTDEPLAQGLCGGWL